MYLARFACPPAFRTLLSGFLLILAALALGGCAVGRQVAFNPADFSVMQRKGSAVISGQVSVDTQNHGTLHPHFQPIVLVPVNTYSTENVQRRYIGGEKLADADKRIVNYERINDTDRDGRFTFRNVPAGDYYIEGELPWLETYISTDDDGINYRYYVSYFKYYFARVTVKDGQAVQVTQFDQRNHERHTHYGTGGTLYHPPANADIFDI
jgi:hypothetical protein